VGKVIAALSTSAMMVLTILSEVNMKTTKVKTMHMGKGTKMVLTGGGGNRSANMHTNRPVSYAGKRISNHTQFKFPQGTM